MNLVANRQQDLAACWVFFQVFSIEVSNVNCQLSQGSLIGQDCFIVSSNDNSKALEEEDIFKYIDDLQILDIVLIGAFLQEYD